MNDFQGKEKHLAYTFKAFHNLFVLKPKCCLPYCALKESFEMMFAWLQMIINDLMIMSLIDRKETQALRKKKHWLCECDNSITQSESEYKK